MILSMAIFSTISERQGKSMRKKERSSSVSMAAKASTNILNVVGKRTDRAVDGGRVPAFLELDAVGFDLAFVEQIIDVGE